jgi:hypothetical protein
LPRDSRAGRPLRRLRPALSVPPPDVTGRRRLTLTDGLQYRTEGHGLAETPTPDVWVHCGTPGERGTGSDRRLWCVVVLPAVATRNGPPQPSRGAQVGLEVP